ncbi:hypothetical protein SSTU70S_05022 [Stutzerimonas stutzeri]
MERDTLSVMGQQGTQSLELALVPTFGTQWLLPRLPRFQALHPQITVNLTNRTRPFLFADTDFDAAIYFGDGDWSGTEAHYLMPEDLQPVCSPALLRDGQPLDAERLAAMPLLQQTTRPYAWRQWFDSLGLKVARDMTGPRLELFSMLAQAAEHGMGVALIPPFLIQRELAEGRLGPTHPHAYRSEARAYYLMIPERKVESAGLVAFRDWLKEEARVWREQDGHSPADRLIGERWGLCLGPAEESAASSAGRDALRGGKRYAVFHPTVLEGDAAGSLLLTRLQVFGQPLKPNHQRRIPLNLDVLVLNPLHERQLLVLRRHGLEPIDRIPQAQGKRRLARRAAFAGDALVAHDEMPCDFAVEGMQLEGQVLVAQLLLELGGRTERLGDQAAQHPKQETEFSW